jgi:hypothetical protein
MDEAKQKLKEQFWDWIDEQPSVALCFAKELIALNPLDGDEASERTLLHEACSNGYFGAVLTLVEAGFDINAEFAHTVGCSYIEGTPLTEAVSAGAKDIIEYLLSFDHLNVRSLAFDKTDFSGDYHFAVEDKGSYIIPFNELFNTPFIERVIELGGTPNDYNQEEDSLLWIAFSKGDIQLLEKLINLGADTQIEGEHEPYIHMVLQQYFESKDDKWIKALELLIGQGVDLSIPCFEGETLMQRILKSRDVKLLELVGLEEETMKEVAEYYEEPQPRLPYELFHPEVDADYIRRDTLGALMDGHFGWKIDKLTRIVNLAITVLEEEFGDIPFMEEIDAIWGDLEVAQINYFLRKEITDLSAYQQEFGQFIDELDKEKKLDNPSERLDVGLKDIGCRIKYEEKALGLPI